MSPAIFNNEGCQQAKKSKMTDYCSSPILKIHKDFRVIHKSSSSSSFSSSPTSSFSSSSSKVTKHTKILRRPVILCTQSPKIIHTHPRNFMALVQKLTGISRDNDDRIETSNPPYQWQQENDHNSVVKHVSQEDDDDSSSAITEEKFENAEDAQIGTSSVSSCYQGANTFVDVR